MFRLAFLLLGLSLGALTIGCGSGSKKEGTPDLVKVAGTVNVNGRPMEGGDVCFSVPGQPPKVLEVKSGKFAGEVFKGKANIEVFLEKDGPPHPMDPKAKLKVNTISEKYWGAGSALNTEISADREDLKFDVTSKK